MAVLDNQGNLLSDEGEVEGAAGVVGQMMKAYQAQERRLEEKIETMLLVSSVKTMWLLESPELKHKVIYSFDEKFDPEGQVPRTQTSDKDTATTVETKPQNKGTGMAANVPNVGQDATAEEPLMAQSDEKRESKTTDFEISRTLREEVQEPGSIVGAKCCGSNC